MGLFDTLLGRSKPVRANLDALFSLPSAAVTLQVAEGIVPTGNAGVCFKPPAGQPFAEVQQQIDQMLALAPESGGEPGPVGKVNDTADSFGYRWIVLDGDAVDDLVNRVHLVHSSLQDAGWSTQLLCSVFGFVHVSGADPPAAIGAGDDASSTGVGLAPPGSRSTLYLVYLAKRGTFYPFAPTGEQARDTELELRLKSALATDLPVESDLSKWFPLWELPVP